MEVEMRISAIPQVVYTSANMSCKGRVTNMIQRLSKNGIFRIAVFAWVVGSALFASGCVWVHREDKDKAPDKVIIKEKEQPTTERVIIEKKIP